MSIICKHHSDGQAATIVPVLTDTGIRDEKGRAKLDLHVIEFNGSHAGKNLKRIDGFAIARDLHAAPKIAYRSNKLYFMTTKAYQFK